MIQHTFLVEIGTNELPPKSLLSLAQNFANYFGAELDIARINYNKILWFASPRRLALKVNILGEVQSDKNIEKRGPSIEEAFDIDGKPSKIAESWARIYGISIKEADCFVTDKGSWLTYKTVVKGEKIKILLCDIVNNTLKKLPISKKMRWNDTNIQFVCPVNTVILLFDKEVIPGKVLGIQSDRVTHGHRFIGEKKICLDHADDYPKILYERGKVIAEFEFRKETIRKNVEEESKKIGGKVNFNDSLLEEITSMVEWPIILSACFEEKFLEIPEEAIIYIMQNDQKCFPVYNAKNKLLPYFIFVANIPSKDPQKIIFDNEKVMRSRLSDASFFFHVDQKMKLEDYLPRLSTVLFHKKLGSLLKKSYRIEKLSGWIANKIGADVKQSMRSGLLSKCDLMSHMVFEFPNTQGIIGMLYAHNDGETELVALAQKEQYLPRFSGDILPSDLVSCTVSIADKIDTIVGIFGITQHQKISDKDPFALRRFSLGILRIIIEKKLSLNLRSLIEEAVKLYEKQYINKTVVDNVIDFILNRLIFWYEEKGYDINVIRSVLVNRPMCPLDIDARIKTINYFRTSSEFTSLITVNKRISNILIKYQDSLYDEIKVSLLKKPEEINLSIHLTKLREKLTFLFENRFYHNALIELMKINDLVNSFFDAVMIITKNREIRLNRLTLLSHIHKLILKIADLSLLK